MHSTRMLLLSLLIGAAFGALALRPVAPVVAAPAVDERGARALEALADRMRDLVRATEKRTECRCECRR